jgi:hypothetical protein
MLITCDWSENLLEVPLEIWNGFQMFGKTIGD